MPILVNELAHMGGKGRRASPADLVERERAAGDNRFQSGGRIEQLAAYDPSRAQTVKALRPLSRPRRSNKVCLKSLK